MIFMIDRFSSNVKNILHGFFLSVAVTIAEPSTVLPVIIEHFSSSTVLIGVFTSLLKGGSILVQLFTAFYAQSYRKVMPYLHLVFLFRFLSWFSIGLSIYLFGDKHPNMTLLFMAFGFFIFSLSAGFGAIFFQEIMAKVFTHKYRGRTVAAKRFFAGLGAIISGGVTGFVLQNYRPPNSYAYLFMVSAFIMSLGFISYGSIKEPKKLTVSKREKHFAEFLRNAFAVLKRDRQLQIQIVVVLISYSYLFAMPFVILKAKSAFYLGGWLIGGFVAVQMLGAMVGNLIWGILSPKFKLIMRISFLFIAVAFIVALFANTPSLYAVFFFLLGAGIDGFRLSTSNLILIIAPEDKRPVYVALQANLTSIGLFFAIPGGLILKISGYNTLYMLTISLLITGFLLSKKLKDE